MPIPSMPPSPPHAAEDGDVFGPLGDYLGFALRAPFRHRGLAIGVLVTCVVLGVLGAALLPKKYQIETVVLAQRNPLMGALSNPTMNRDWDAPTRAAKEVVTRRENLVALCRQTDLVRRYLATRPAIVRARDWVYERVFRRTRTDAQLEENLVDTLANRFSVWVTNEGAVTMQFTWTDADITFDVAQAALDSFLEARNAAEAGAVVEAIGILKGHDARVQQDIAEAIRKLDAKEQALRIRATPRRLPRVRSLAKPDEELDKLQAQLAARRRTLAELEDARQRRISELQMQLSQYQGVYAPEHPNVVAARQGLAAVQVPPPQIAELKGEIARIEKAITARPGGVVEPPQQGALEEELAAARAALLDQPDPRLDYERRQLETLLRRHASLLERIEGARIELDTTKSGFQQRYVVITPPIRPRGPMRPYNILFVVGGIFAGVVFAAVATAGRDLWRGRVVEAWQIERELKLPLLSAPRR